MMIKGSALIFFAWGFWYLVGSSSCKSNEGSVSIVNFHIRYAYGQKVYLETIPLPNEKMRIIDSEIIKNGNDRIVFKIQGDEERPYEVRVKESPLNIMFINDASPVEIDGNFLHPEQYKVQGSPGTTALNNFMQQQAALMQENRKESYILDSLKKSGTSPGRIDSLQQKVQMGLANFFRRYINFADTISSSGAFLYIFNQVDYGDNNDSLKNFIIRAAHRFPEAKRVQQLKEETLEFLKIFEEEYNVGDQLPAVELPDNTGNMFSTSLLKGKYVFMDFWSTWCARCMAYDDEKIKAKKMFPPGKFDIVSIAYDDQTEAWKSYIAGRKLDWHQLIDEKMWNGIAEKTFKIDSIPFNFILDPNGKVLYKAVKKDSLLPILKRIIR
jgi:thiol-disulfide isomerase/thioredoxin